MHGKPMNTHSVSALAWERMVTAVEKVRERLRRAARALEGAGIPYAVVGGNAVAAWVGEVDDAAVRNTPDVDILLRRADLQLAKDALEAVDFIYRDIDGVDMFLDGAEAKARDAIHIVFAGEKVRQDYSLPAPDVEQSKATPTCRVLDLEALVVMELASFRIKDRVHVRDLIDVGLVDSTWTARLPSELAARLQELLDTPDG